jgi:NADPH-dependent curcumin reductase
MLVRSVASGQSAGPNLLPATMRAVLSKSGGAHDSSTTEHYAEFLKTVSAALADGRVRYREDITDGFENAPVAFIGMLAGRNFGKALVRVAH